MSFLESLNKVKVASTESKRHPPPAPRKPLTFLHLTRC